MTYEYGSESKRLELPNPYRLQNRLLWLCAVLLVGAGVLSLLWARSAMQESALRLAAAPILAGLLLVAAGLAAAATAATPAALLLRPRPAGLARAGDPGRGDRRLARGRPDQGVPAPGRPDLSRAGRRGRGPALPLGADPDHGAARGPAAGPPLRLQPGGDRGDAGQLPVLLVRLRQPGHPALDRDPVLRLRPGVPAEAGAVAEQGPGHLAVAGRPDRRGDPRPGGDRPGRGEAALARRLLARHPDVRDAVHGAGRLRPGDGGGARPGRRGAADAGQRRAAAPVDERAAGDPDGRARPADAGEPGPSASRTAATPASTR